MNMELFERIDETLRNGSRANVVISGITCSGKSTLANLICKRYNVAPYKDAVSIMPQDEYFKDLKDIPKSRFGALLDSTDAFHTDEYERDVQCLLQHGSVLIPQYNVANNVRTPVKKQIQSNQINVFEGLHTISILKNIPDTIKVFVDTPPRVCLQRRIDRDTSKYGIPENRVREFWEDVIMPLSFRFVYPQKLLADIVLTSEGGEYVGS